MLERNILEASDSSNL